MSKKIITILGARPQFIKSATVSREILSRNTLLNERILHTGQHYDSNMSDVFFQEMDIPKPNFQLNIQGRGHGQMTGQMLHQIEKILIKENPQMVLVYGDTNSTLAGALAAKKLHIPIAHVEAGLRSYNMKMPEEINRILTDRISDLLFCPSQNAVNNLRQEGYNNFGIKVLNPGDVMYDAALYYGNKEEFSATFFEEEYVLSTIHRAENTDDKVRLSEIVSALNEINSHTKVIVPLHPRTKKIIDKEKLCTDFQIIEPVGYLHMINLIKNGKIVLTDSGGLQKEAYFFGKYCITMRDETEWVELVNAKVNRLTGANKDAIVQGYYELKDKKMSNSITPYGNGEAAMHIVNELEKFVG